MNETLERLFSLCAQYDTETDESGDMVRIHLVSGQYIDGELIDIEDGVVILGDYTIPGHAIVAVGSPDDAPLLRL